MGLFQPVEVCLQNTLKEFTEVYTTKVRKDETQFVYLYLEYNEINYLRTYRTYFTLKIILA